MSAAIAKWRQLARELEVSQQRLATVQDKYDNLEKAFGKVAGELDRARHGDRKFSSDAAAMLAALDRDAEDGATGDYAFSRLRVAVRMLLERGGARV